MEIAKKKVIGQLSPAELTKIQNNRTELNKLRYTLGSIEMEKYNLLKKIDELQYESKVMENKIIKKFGDKAVINTQSGEVSE